MMRAYSQVAWGLALELIDIRFGSFDLFPDVIGFLLLLIGLSHLRMYDERFKIAWIAAGVLFILSVLQLFGLQIGFSLTNYETPSVPVLIYTSFSIAVDLVMLFGICRGIQRLALSWRKVELSRVAGSGWSVIFGLGFLMLFLFPFQLNYTLQDALPVVFLLALGYLVASLWVILLVRRAGRELPSNKGDPNPDPDLGNHVDIIA
ncbi:hypothetical protein [Cohnella sp. WQ 127256]|uniref:hypothetical protein n=1 Tax=Cohnella sp. WQ 127256 TaxID=2938790 RepID=UPI002119874D|nr:hypothetical protein [Cohnella sp. WQ 127256]